MVELTRDNLSEYKNYAPYRKAKVLFDKIIKKGVIDQTEMLNVTYFINLLNYIRVYHHSNLKTFQRL